MSIQNPVQMPVKVFSSEDTDAPQLSAKPLAGEIVTVFKGCLINGYGSTAPQSGWTMPFEDGNKAVFRSAHPQSPHYYRVDNSTGVGGTLGAYYSMADIDNGDAWWSPSTWKYTYQSEHTPGGWRLLTTETTIIFICLHAAYGVVNECAVAVIGGTQAAVVGGMSTLLFKYQYHSGIDGNNYRRVVESTYDGAVGGKVFSVQSASAHAANVNNAEQFLMPTYIRYSGRIIGQLPIYTGDMAMPERIVDSVSIGARTFMQIKTYSNGNGPEVLYIPTDYWTL